MNVEAIEKCVERLGPNARNARLRRVRQGDESALDGDEAAGTLTAAISAAARAGAETSASSLGLELADLKRAIDGAATAAAEEVFAYADLKINVVAGEGERDDSPGAHAGQTIGRTDSEQVWDGIFDYVDGTTLAAQGLPGALSLGGLGVGIRPVPDLQAYVVLAPREVLSQLDIMSPPENHALNALEIVAETSGNSVSDMTVLTHSTGSGKFHQSLIDLLRKSTREVIVPAPVSIEPPYLLSLIGLTSPRIDSMIGAMGLSELAFASALLDLVAPGYGFAFRMASIDGPRSSPSNDLGPLFDFSDREVKSLEMSGWRVDQQYTSDDIVPTGQAAMAAIFGVTGGGPLGLAAPRTHGRETTTSGLLLFPGGSVFDVRVVEHK
jgi:fructose-1,6-bisphosphatase/sedoheptulose 1,7-bisphosphatase-like protein